MWSTINNSDVPIIRKEYTCMDQKMDSRVESCRRRYRSSGEGEVKLMQF